MSVEILNPDNTAMQQLDGHWQKMFAFLLWKTSGTSVVKITVEDMKALEEKFAPGIPCVFTHGHYDNFEFSLVTEDAAARLAEHDKKMRGMA